MMSLSEQTPTEDELRARLEREGLTPTWWFNGPGAVYAVHAHPYTKALIVVEGEMTVSLKRVGRTIRLKAGDRLDVPPEIPHSAVVGPSGVVCLEAHLSRR